MRSLSSPLALDFRSIRSAYITPVYPVIFLKRGALVSVRSTEIVLLARGAPQRRLYL